MQTDTAWTLLVPDLILYFRYVHIGLSKNKGCRSGRHICRFMYFKPNQKIGQILNTELLIKQAK